MPETNDTPSEHRGEPTGEEPEVPHEVGESTTRRGEDIAERDGKEPGRHDGPTDPATGRSSGYSDERDVSGI
jgi:hypothetical protein